MSGGDLSTLLSRIDFAWITSVHILYPPLTIGLAMLLFFSEWRWVRTNDDKWYRLCRFFERLFIVNFGAGVATGVTMEMAFGILYGRFSQAAGPFFGQVLGYETITAFMYEAGFLGLMVFGWGKINKKIHLFATFNVALSSTLSAFWILVANSWLQTPSGVEMKNGVLQMQNWAAAIFNPDVFTAFPHMELAAVEIALCFVAAVCAWFVLKGRHVELFREAAEVCGAGPALGRAAAGLHRRRARPGHGGGQPAALAAMEGHYHRDLPNGQVNNNFNVVAWPNAQNDGNAFSIKVPHMLSLLETHTWNGAVPGLNDIKPADRPPVVMPFYAFRAMAGIGGALLLLALWGAWLALRGQLSAAKVARNRWFLRAVVASMALPYIAIWTGWWTREIGRQPWLVYGLMRTSEGVSHMSVAAAVIWLVGFVVFEVMVVVTTWYFMAKIVRTGPDLDSPVAVHSHQTGAVGGHAHAHA